MAKSIKKKKGNGEGSVYKTKSGYRGQIVVGIDDDGKPIRRSVTGKTAKEVNEKLTMIKNSIITGTYIAPNRITLCELARLMIEDDLNMNYIKETTYYRNIETLKRIEKDKQFRKWIIQNKKILLNEYGDYPYFSTTTVLDAYKQNFDLLTTFHFELKKKELMNDYNFKHFSDLIPNKEIPKFMEYIKTQGISCALYDDYVSACKFLNLDMSLPKNKYPHDFMRWHDIRINEKHSKEAELDKEKRKQLYKQFSEVANKYLTLQRDKKDKYIMLIAKSPAELINEGEKLHHCVGRMGYDQKFAKEESLIFFIRTKEEPETPLATLEYSLENHKILQCYADHDRKPSDEILNYVKRKWLPYANRKIRQIAI